MNTNGKYVLLYQYLQGDMAVDDKIRQVKETFPCMSGVYEQDLRILFEGREYLPLIKGVEISTRGRESECSYVAVTEMTKTTDMQKQSEFQKAFMRICGCLGGFRYEKWGIGEPNDTMKKHLRQYFAERNVNWIRGVDAGYPRVLEVLREIVENMPNESYEIAEVSGIRLD